MNLQDSSTHFPAIDHWRTQIDRNNLKECDYEFVLLYTHEVFQTDMKTYQNFVFKNQFSTKTCAKRCSSDSLFFLWKLAEITHTIALKKMYRFS